MLTDPDLKEKVILVVEDEVQNWYLLRDIIELCNGNAIWAKNGLVALESIKNNKYDLILLDIKLPFLTGIELTKKIRPDYPDLPIIIQSAFSDPDIIRECRKAGCSEFLSKPVSIYDVYQVFNNYLEL